MITAKNERQIVMYSGFSYNGISEDVLAMVIRTNLGNSIDDNVPRMLQAAAYNTAQSHDAFNIFLKLSVYNLYPAVKLEL